jgi:hypothetical protein
VVFTTRPFLTKRILIATIILVVIIASVAVVFVPQLVNALVEDKISRVLVNAYDLSGEKDLKIKVESHFTGLVSGTVDHVRINGKNIAIKGIEAETLEIKLDGVRFDLAVAVLDRKANILGIDSGWTRVEVGESTLNGYISEKYKGSDSLVVSLPGDGMEVVKTIPIIGSVTVKFQPLLQGGYLILHPVDVLFPGKERLPAAISDLIPKDDIAIDLPIKTLPFNMNVKRVKVLKGKIELIADNKT